MKKALTLMGLIFLLGGGLHAQFGIRVDLSSPILAARQGQGAALGGELFLLRNNYGLHLAAEYKESDSTLYSFNGDTLRNYFRYRWSVGSEYFGWSFQEREGTGLFFGGRLFVDYLTWQDSLVAAPANSPEERQKEWGFGANLTAGYNLGIGKVISLGIRGGWNFYLQPTQQMDRFWGYIYFGIGF